MKLSVNGDDAQCQVKIGNMIAEIAIAQKVLSRYAQNLQRSLLYHHPVPIKYFMVLSSLFFLQLCFCVLQTFNPKLSIVSIAD